MEIKIRKCSDRMYDGYIDDVWEISRLNADNILSWLSREGVIVFEDETL